MSAGLWDVDDIVQVSPTHDERFGGALLVVTETKPWGVQGYVVIPGGEEPGLSYYRLPYEPSKDGCSVTGFRVGRAHWLFDREGATDRSEQ